MIRFTPRKAVAVLTICFAPVIGLALADEDVAPRLEAYHIAAKAQSEHNAQIMKAMLESFSRDAKGEYAKLRRIQLASLRNRIRLLEDGLAFEAPLIDPFDLSLGDIGMSGTVRQGLTQEAAESLVKGGLPIREVAQYKVLQILEDRSVLVLVQAPRRDSTVILVRGFNTAGLVTGKNLAMNEVFEVVDTTTYETPIGSTNTVFVLQVYSPNEFSRHLKAIAAKNKEAVEKAESKTPTQRRWKDTTGEFSVTAEFLGVEADSVKLRKGDGTILTVPLERLSDSDQDWVKNQEPDSR